MKPGDRGNLRAPEASLGGALEFGTTPVAGVNFAPCRSRVVLPGAAIMGMMRLLWNLLGFALVGTGFVGVAIPGMPSTIFFILALAAFTKGANEKWRRKLLDHKVIGPTLTHWERHRSISRRIKWVACLSIVVFCGLSVIAIRKPWVKAVVGGLGLAGIGYIVTRRNTEDIDEYSGTHAGVSAADHLGA